MKRFYFKKIVRDKIIGRNALNPDVLHTEYRVLVDEEYRRELVKKIAEESAEVPLDGSNMEEVCKELADLQSVVNELRKSFGVSEQEVNDAITEKTNEAGGFSQRHYIEYVDIADDSKWVEIFRSQPDKYREEDRSEKG